MSTLISTIKKTASRYTWLFLTAAWLYTLSFIFTNYFSGNSSPEKAAGIIEKYLHPQEEIFYTIASDTSVLYALVNDSPSVSRKNLLNDGVGIFVYQLNDLGNPVLVFWNTNSLQVNTSDVLKPATVMMTANTNGHFELLKKSFNYKGLHWIICAMIPVKWEYFLTNEYLESKFAVESAINNNYTISYQANDAAVKNKNGKTLFYIHQKNTLKPPTTGNLSIFFRLLAVLLFCLYIERIASALATTNGLWQGLGLLSSFLFLFRFISYKTNFPFSKSSIGLFDPAIYASSELNSSLGDLMINVILVFWLVVFVRKHLLTGEKAGNIFPAVAGKTVAWIFIALLPIITLYVVKIIISLIVDSTIVLDTANFFALSIYTFLSLIIISLAVYCWFYITGFIILFSRLHTNAGTFWRIVALAGCSLLYISVSLIDLKNNSLSLSIACWLIIYFLLMEYGSNPITKQLIQSPAFILWALFLMASVTALISYENFNEELETRKRIAEKLDEQTDPAALSLLNMTISNFSGDRMRKHFERFYNGTENQALKDSLISENFSGYLNKYDTHIYTFDRENKPLYNEDSISYDAIKTVLLNTAKPAGIDNLYYYENAADRFGYIYEDRIYSSDSSFRGSLFVFMYPRAYQNDALQPELFKQTSNAASDLNDDYAYVIYNNGHIADHFNNYNFTDILGKENEPRMMYDYKKNNGYSELWYSPGNQKTIIIVRKNNTLTRFITLFAYLFIVFILTAFFIHAINLLLLHGITRNNLSNVFNFNIRNQVQATIAGISILSFIIIGAATISFFILRFNKNSKKELTGTGEIVVNEVQALLNSQEIDYALFNPDFISIDNPLDRMLTELAERQKTSINLYSLSGTLLATSQPLLFNRQILSNYIQPAAFYQLRYRKSIQVIQEEQVGNFKFQSLYIPVRNDAGDPVAYVNIPSLNSQNELKLEISNFLVTLITLNAIIFIFAGAIALILTNRITASFELIGSKMKEVSLGKTNEVIAWKNNDEIGALVNEYNKMVNKLEASASALAKSEREGAWREMARQVAHEIKNPLTPMKLSIQYLQKAIENNAPNTRELSQRVAGTLVEQIDQLSKIAGDFSQFANIGNIRPERFNLIDLTDKLILLYQTDNRLTLQYHKPANPVYIMADKTQINRLLTNLIKNAIEASAQHGESIPVMIDIENKETSVTISITDKGTGIPESMQQKIFEPNFTTKTSGTGLGLAICKAITEKANGHIWFETADNYGSTFYVSFTQIA